MTRLVGRSTKTKNWRNRACSSFSKFHLEKSAFGCSEMQATHQGRRKDRHSSQTGACAWKTRVFDRFVNLSDEKQTLWKNALAKKCEQTGHPEE